MAHGYFITGTDTDAGKTWIALALLSSLRQKGYRTLAMKPVACGCLSIDGEYRNDDAVQLQQQASVAIPYEMVNPYAFSAPIAPHLAAEKTGQRIDIHHIKQLFDQQRDKADYVIMEGAGGWLVPLNTQHTTADLVKILQLPVILVVAIRLGCLNHTLLTNAAIQHEGIQLAGWIANCIDESSLEIDNNIETLRERLNAPLLGVIPYLEECNVQTIADHLDIEKLIKKGRN